MKLLNLIPDEFCLHQTRRKRLRGWIVLWLVLATILLSWSGFRYIFYLKESAASQYLNKQYLNLQEKLQSLTQTTPALQDPDAELDLVDMWPESVYFQELQIIESKTNVPPNAATKSTTAQTLAMFNTNLADTSDTHSASSTDKSTNQNMPSPQSQLPLTLNIKAVAVHHNAVAVFYRVIQQCPYLRQSQLIQTHRQQIVSNDVIYFEIQADIYQPAYAEVQYADIPSTAHF